jgi:hypothetical protein
MSENEEIKDELDVSLSFKLFKVIKTNGMDSSMHGLSRIFTKMNVTSFYRLLWTMITAVMSALCFSLIVGSIEAYFTYSVTTKLLIYEEKEVEYPSVTFCNVNRYLTKEANSFYDTILTSEKANSLKLLENVDYERYKDILQTLNSLVLLKQDNLTSSDQQKKLSYTFDQMVIECQFKKAKCNESNFEWFFDRLYGNCWSFKSTETIISSGSVNGLTMQIYVKPQKGSKFNKYIETGKKN